MIGVVGVIVAPGRGLATTVALRPGGNQLTIDWLEFSQGRGWADTKIDPAGVLRGSGTTLCGDARTWRLRWPDGP